MNMMTNDFAKKFGDEFLEHIALVVIGDIKDDSIYFCRQTQHDAINSSGFGYFERDGIEWGFGYENGNWNGFQITKFGEEVKDTYRPTRRVLKPDKDRLVGQIRIAHPDWTEEQVANFYTTVTLKIFEVRKEKLEKEFGSLSYDEFFSPTNVSTSRTRKWLETNYLTYEHEYVNT